MARLAIEDKWWTDPRRSKLMKLLNGEDAADLAALRLWKLAQSFWGNGQQLIPLEMFELLDGAAALKEAQLVIIEDGQVYAKGTREWLNWLHEKRLAASEGGKKSAENRRKKNGTAIPKNAPNSPKQRRSSAEANSSSTEPSGSGSFSGSGSGSGLDFAELHENAENSPVAVAPVQPNEFIAGYCERWKIQHGSNPPITGKDAGIAKRVAKDWSCERASHYLDAFFSMPDSYVIRAKHPLELFEMKLKEIAAFADSGNFITRKQAVQADDMASNMILLDKVRKGKK